MHFGPQTDFLKKAFSSISPGIGVPACVKVMLRTCTTNRENESKKDKRRSLRRELVFAEGREVTGAIVRFVGQIIQKEKIEVFRVKCASEFGKSWRMWLAGLCVAGRSGGRRQECRVINDDRQR